MALTSQKVSSMGYDIKNDDGDVIAYAKKVGFEKYRLTIGDKQLGYHSTVDACIKRLSK